MRSLEEISLEIEDLKYLISEFKMETEDYEGEFNDHIDQAGSLFICDVEFRRSDILKEMDDMAYNQALSDFVDSLDKEDNSDYKELEDKLEELLEEKEKAEDYKTEMSDGLISNLESIIGNIEESDRIDQALHDRILDKIQEIENIMGW